MIAKERIVGLLMLFGGLVIVLGALSWLRIGVADGDLSETGYAIALLLTLALSLPVMSGGIYLIIHGVRRPR